MGNKLLILKTSNSTWNIVNTQQAIIIFIREIQVFPIPLLFQVISHEHPCSTVIQHTLISTVCHSSMGGDTYLQFS